MNGAPWIVKKYIDEVFTIGHGRLYQSDGRSRKNADQHYGSGGLIQGKQYMLSVTWNAPEQPFTDPQQILKVWESMGCILQCIKRISFWG
ncbi:NAD(P)H-dependent oxidoreductase [Shewanella phaeophyticola]|uniref:NAD(P)H-dependent oxidoreductase n=1 Tax=Shewanella phaeophyticola TaxID=2978345 RepID=UPI0036F3C74C